jgi:two-component system, cell cycle response regulator
MPYGITASFGMAELAAGEQGDAFMRRVDKALYKAKHSGRNCVVVG